MIASYLQQKLIGGLRRGLIVCLHVTPPRSPSPCGSVPRCHNASHGRQPQRAPRLVPEEPSNRTIGANGPWRRIWREAIGKSDSNRVVVRNPVLIRSPYLHLTANLLSLINQLAHSIQANNANYPPCLSHTSFPPSEGATVFIMAATRQIVLRWGSPLSLGVNYWFQMRNPMNFLGMVP